MGKYLKGGAVAATDLQPGLAVRLLKNAGLFAIMPPKP
jgi:hypothetical protein